MMSVETTKLDNLTKLVETRTINYSGISCPCDIALWDGNYKIVLLSFYGSMSQIKAIFAGIAQYNSIYFDNSSIYIRRNSRTIKLKQWKIGHGKYHAIIYDSEYYKDTVLFFSNNKDAKIKAWKQFLNQTKIPVLDEWIPKLVAKLLSKGYISRLEGYGLSGYNWKANDDSVCDLIVEEIYKP